MFNGTVLDVAVGLIFVFLMLSVACSLVNERIQSFFDRRAKMLQAAIEGMLGPEAKDLIAHPLIQALSSAGSQHVSMNTRCPLTIYGSYKVSEVR